MKGSYLDEILEQPGVLAKIAVGFDRETEGKLTSLRNWLASGAFSRIILTGMGGSLIGSYASWLELTRGLDVPVQLIDAAELTQQVPGMIGSRTLIIATSQSGESGEIVHITRLTQQPRQIGQRDERPRQFAGELGRYHPVFKCRPREHGFDEVLYRRARRPAPVVRASHWRAAGRRTGGHRRCRTRGG